MSKSNKRTLADIGVANPFPSAKRARTQHAAPLPPAPESASQIASSPTLIASTLISTHSPNTSATNSVTNAPTTISASSEPSSSANSSSDSDTPPVQNHFIPTYHIPISVSTSSTGTTSSSQTSTSASITDSVSCSTCSPTNSQDPSSASITDSSSTSTNSQDSSSDTDSTSTSPARTLTAKNLATLQQRLHSLLPRLQSANELLERERQHGRLAERDIENVHDEVAGGYIAMELGLGVLEQRVKRGAGAVGMGSGGGGGGGGGESGDSIEGWDMVMDKGMAIGKVMRRRGVGGKRKVGIERV